MGLLITAADITDPLLTIFGSDGSTPDATWPDPAAQPAKTPAAPKSGSTSGPKATSPATPANTITIAKIGTVTHKTLWVAIGVILAVAVALGATIWLAKRKK